MKYSKNFERDYDWYLKYKDVFTFDGSPAPEDKIIYSPGDKSAKESFYIYDSSGKVIPTSEPDLLREIFKCKGSINLHIKLYSEGRADGTLPKILFQEVIEEFELLPWMVEAVEKQRHKYYSEEIN